MLVLVVLELFDILAFHQLVVHPKSRVWNFPPTSTAHLNNILASMVGTVEMTNRLEVMSDGVFLALVLVGDYRDFT